MNHYFSAQPGGPGRSRTVEFQVGGRKFALASADGVFSADRLDPGTGVLLRKAPLPAADEPGPLLDLGCGYGPIGCVLASVAPRATVWAVDVNERARELAAGNAAALGLDDRLRVADPDGVPDDVRFRQIWSNPPIRIGKPQLHAMLRQWLPRLVPGGVAWLVVARYLGGDSLQQWLRSQGWETTRHASQQGYRVLRVVGPPTQREAVVAVVARAGRVLVIRRGPEAVFPGYWAPLSGRVEPGEEQSAAVTREVREEVGLRVRPLAKVWESQTHDGAFRLHWWTAQAPAGEVVPDPGEVSEARWVRPEEFRTLAPTFAGDHEFFDRVLPGLRLPE